MDEEEPPLKKARLAVDVEEGDGAVVIDITADDHLLPPPTSMGLSNTMTLDDGAVDNEGEPAVSDDLPMEPLVKDASSARVSPVKPALSSHPASTDKKGFNKDKVKDNSNNNKKKGKGGNAKGKGGDGHDKVASREEEEALAIGDSGDYNSHILFHLPTQCSIYSSLRIKLLVSDDDACIWCDCYCYHMVSHSNLSTCGEIPVYWAHS
jgi:hypothetical protein